MKMFKKPKLSFGITLTVVGAGLTALSCGLVAAGTHGEVYKSMTVDGVKVEVGLGVGSVNYGSFNVSYIKDGSIISEDKAGTANTKVEEIKKTFYHDQTGPIGYDLKTKGLSEFEKALKDANKKINEDAQSARNTLAEAQKELAAAEKEGDQSKIDTAKAKVKTAKDELDKKLAPINSNDEVLSAINSANAMMLSGSILMIPFIAVMGMGIAITVLASLNKKKQTVSE